MFIITVRTAVEYPYRQCPAIDIPLRLKSHNAGSACRSTPLVSDVSQPLDHAEYYGIQNS